MQRRAFLHTALASSAATLLPAQFANAQSAPAPVWGSPILDTHLHLNERRKSGACLTHMQGCGVSHAVLLTGAPDQDRAKKEIELYPNRFVHSVRTDPTTPGAISLLRTALTNGAVSIGEMKFNIALNSPQMRRVYDLAAELRVPVMLHIQDFPHYPGEKPYNTGYPEFDKVLRAHPRTNFIGHGDLFWAHISAHVPTDRGYPNGPIQPGGLTDKWLAEHPNLYADMSANSGNNALSRDPSFTPAFLARHSRKLIFGSDCSCSDGNGSGVSQNRNPEAARLAGKCVARETLAVLKKHASPQHFRRLVWDNAIGLFRLKFA